jgi:hypothetical protein
MSQGSLEPTMSQLCWPFLIHKPAELVNSNLLTDWFYTMATVVRRSSTAILEASLLEGLMELLKKTFHGQLVLIVQNFRVVQIERKENFNPEDLLDKNLALTLESFKPQLVSQKLNQALKGLEFGQVVLVVKKGRLMQIERLQKERFSDLQGLAGDGI